MVMDALVASGTPNAMAVTGPLAGSTYRQIVQDMADGYINCMYGGYSANQPVGGGWRYGCYSWPDNSVNQWAAIGLIPAERLFGAIIDPNVKPWNKVWLAYTQTSEGAFGYDQPGYWPWGPYADSPSGMVQMVMDHIGRGNNGAPSWDKGESFLRDNFCNPPSWGPYYSIRDYYYGMFSFSKSMLLAVQDGTTNAGPIQMLQTTSGSGLSDIDWYAAESSKGDQCDGVARTLVSDQDPGGSWWGHNFVPDQFPMETAMAIIMLNRTIFQSGAPVAVAQAIPNPGTVGATITLNGSQSFHQDGTKQIVKWEWDLTGTGNNFTLTGPTVQTTFAALGTYPVRLRVTDNSNPARTAEAIVSVLITIPPIAPSADAGGPYILCPQAKPWFLDGSKSVNPDNGLHDPGPYPGDFIKAYDWDLSGTSFFSDASGVKPNVTSFYTAKGPGAYLASLRVTDNTAASFPSSGFPDLTSVSSAQVIVKDLSDQACSSCIGNLKAYAKAKSLTSGFVFSCRGPMSRQPTITTFTGASPGTAPIPKSGPRSQASQCISIPQ
jgi:hypothetical protein